MARNGGTGLAGFSRKSPSTALSRAPAGLSAAQPVQLVKAVGDRVLSRRTVHGLPGTAPINRLMLHDGSRLPGRDGDGMR